MSHSNGKTKTAKSPKEEAFSGKTIFQDLPQGIRREILEAGEKRYFPADAVIFRQGDPAGSFYIINSGRVKIYRQAHEGLEIDLNILASGESFGEMALVTGNPRSGYAVTLEETRLTVLAKEAFDRILQKYPDVSLSFIKQMSEWLARDDQRLEKVIKQQFEIPRPTFFDFVILIGFSLLLAFTFNYLNPNAIKLVPDFWADESVPMVRPQAAGLEYDRAKALFVDARPANFYEEGHIKGAINMPLALFDIMYTLELGAIDRARSIIVYGRSISSLYDEQVARKLLLRGHKNVRILKDGLSAWKERGYPTEP